MEKVRFQLFNVHRYFDSVDDNERLEHDVGVRSVGHYSSTEHWHYDHVLLFFNHDIEQDDQRTNGN